MVSLVIKDVGLYVQMPLWTCMFRHWTGTEKASKAVPWHSLNLVRGNWKMFVSLHWSQKNSSFPSKMEDKSTNYSQMCYSCLCWDRATPHREIVLNTAICTSPEKGKTIGHYCPGLCLNQGWEMKGSTLQSPEGMCFPFMKHLSTGAEIISIHLNSKKQ